MIYWLPKHIPELKTLSEQGRETALKSTGQKIWWRLAIWFLVVFLIINQMVNILFERLWPTAGALTQALLGWVVQILLLLLIMLPVYCGLLRKQLRKEKKTPSNSP